MITRNQLKVTISTELSDDYHGQRRSDWEANAEFWATYIDNESSRRMLLHDVAKRVARLTQNQPTKILDLGVGEGTFLRLCHNTLPDAELFGIDFSQSILNAAEKRSSTLSISLSLGDFEDEDFNLNTLFNIITAIFTFDEANDLDASFAAVGRHLNQDGRAVVVILDPVLESFRYNSFRQSTGENKKAPQLMLISKHFYARSAVSPAPYYRIVRPIADYTAAAELNGLALLSLDRTSFSTASNDSLVGPIANILTFGKESIS